MKEKRSITVKVIDDNKKINYKLLAKFFADTYSKNIDNENYTEDSKASKIGRIFSICLTVALFTFIILYELQHNYNIILIFNITFLLFFHLLHILIKLCVLYFLEYFLI